MQSPWIKEQCSDLKEGQSMLLIRKKTAKNVEALYLLWAKSLKGTCAYHDTPCKLGHR